MDQHWGDPAEGEHNRRHRRAAVPGGAGDDLRFGVLGPLRIWRGQAKVTIPGRQRTLLALLALNANLSVSRDMIMETLWRDDPPTGAVGIIQTYMSRLRRALDEGAEQSFSAAYLLRSGKAYMLRVADEQLDMLAFDLFVGRARAAVAAGDGHAAAQAYGEALRLWRDEPLTDVEELKSHPSVIGLMHCRASVTTEYAQVMCEAGWHDRALPYLRELAAREPLNERAQAGLMVALAGTGQQAEALNVYAEVRRRLDDQLGVIPCAETRDAYVRVLRQQIPYSGQGSSPASSWRCVYQLPSPPADFTGRADDLKRLKAVLTEPEELIGVRTAVVSGMPGVGKTALALRSAHEVRLRFPDGQLWIPLDGSTARPRDPGEVLGYLLRVLGVPEASVPPGSETRAASFRSLLTGRKVLLVLDDAGSVAQIRPLLPGTAETAVLITSRTPLALLNGEVTIVLDVMTEDEAVRMLAGAVGKERVVEDPGAAAQLVRACGRLPLAIRIAAAKLAARISWPVSVMATRLDSPQGRLDELEAGDLSVRTSILASYRTLGEASRQALTMLAGLGSQSCTEPLIAAVLGRPDVSGVLSELIDSSLVIPAGVDSAGEPSYLVHQLVRDVAAELVSGDAYVSGIPV